ncbi:NHL repeat-containing protein [Hymenobacter sp. M29]|uniref:NHL repeat-containing protein n=1 Tax=Hymenobacter mellowenesis TaxID=3063995 RepID=A0ABT9ADS8_9BACT|nr:NHL repeat-containing protein [Hymenobacter sp. M29]MDO7848010.1 NHL repeat-containing protein [Hymenobacter sp. M29]
MTKLSALAVGALLLLGLNACKKEKETPADPEIVYTKVSTLAGNGTFGFVDGAGTAAQFNGPDGVAVDGQGNVYVADNANSSIRKITPTGVVTTLAGNGTSGFADGPLAAARFYGPGDVAFDGQGNLYVADYDNQRIRKITPGGIVSTLAGSGTTGFADGPGTSAHFNGPYGLAVDGQGVVYVSDFENNRIRKVLPNGTVSTLAGTGGRGSVDGPGSSAQIANPEGLALDGQGNLYVSEFGGHRIRKITPNGTVSTLAGTGTKGFADGPGNMAQFFAPTGITIDAHGDLLVAEIGNHCIRKVTPAGVVTTVAGTRAMGFVDGAAGTAQFQSPSGIAAGPRGVLYLTEYGDRIRKITAE